MGFMEERWAGASYVVVNTSAASVTNPITGSGILESVTINAAPTSAFHLIDGADEDGTRLAIVAAATDPVTLNYGIRFGSDGIGVSAQSSDTDIVIAYIPDPIG